MSAIALASASGTHAGSGATPELPVVLHVNADSPPGAIDALLLSEFLAGRQPWARGERIDVLRDGADLVPDTARTIRVAALTHRTVTLAVGPGWTLRVIVWRTGSAHVTVTAVTAALADEIVDRVLVEGRADPEPETHTSIGFWHTSPSRGPERAVRRIRATDWPAIRGNYAAPVAAALDGLVAVTPATVHGRLVLLHGPPGTGKTTALRALAHAWRDWCQVDCVLDPEHLLADAGYLNEVAVGEDDDQRWRLLILEDCDELIRADAKSATGQALARLLNLTDGLLGQGRDVLVAITTNEDLARLHPAVTRPGRCLARIEVGRLPGGETLAERYAREAGRPVPAVTPAPIGGYL